MNKNLRIYSAIVFVMIGIILFSFSFYLHNFKDNAENKIEKIISLKDNVKQDLINNGKYKCCLEKPCDYCLINHKECDCLEEIVTGKHPCGECIGEILEGHGNRFLTKYFSKALSEKIGENHHEHLKEIISEKYSVSIESQL